MELLVVILVVAAIWWWLKSKKSSTAGVHRQAPSPAVPELKLTITSSVGSRRASSNEAPPRDVGPLTSVGQGAWILNPISPLPLTLIGANESTAKRVRAVLAKRQYWSQSVPELTLLIAQHNLRFTEVDEFVTHCRPKFEALVQQAIANSSEWPTASEKDRKDLRAEFEDAALEKLGVHIGYADLATLLDGQPSGFEDDDELLRRFGSDSALYSFFLTQLGRASSAVTVKADDWSRKSWEKLVEMGLAIRGKDIPVQRILEGLRLKDLNEMLVGAVPKPLGRKAKAVEAVLALPDLQERISRFVSLREKFQAVPPPNLDVEKLHQAFGYATAVATVVQQTYYTAVETLDVLDEKRRDPDMYDAWEIVNFQEPMPACAKPYCKKYSRLPAKRPPFHLGCDCQLEGGFKD